MMTRRTYTLIKLISKIITFVFIAAAILAYLIINGNISMPAFAI